MNTILTCEIVQLCNYAVGRVYGCSASVKAIQRERVSLEIGLAGGTTETIDTRITVQSVTEWEQKKKRTFLNSATSGNRHLYIAAECSERTGRLLDWS